MFSVPQGPCVGPILYSIYASTIRDVVPSDIQIHAYADDHAIKRSYQASSRSAETTCMTELSRCCDDIKTWMDTNRLKMNSSKTEFIVFGYKSQLEKCCVNNIRVNNDDTPRTGVIKYLGAHLDQHLNMKYHIQSKCNATMLNLLRLKNIRPYLTASACTTLVLGTVIYHLDFVNSLFSCLPNYNVSRTWQQN